MRQNKYFDISSGRRANLPQKGRALKAAASGNIVLPGLTALWRC